MIICIVLLYYYNDLKFAAEVSEGVCVYIGEGLSVVVDQ